MKQGFDLGHGKIPRAVPAARWKAQREGIDLRKVTGSGPQGCILVRDLEDMEITKKFIASKEEEVRVSSLARKLAEKKGISLDAVEGTGTRGRIMMGDVMKVNERPAVPLERRLMFGQSYPVTQMRKMIAKRMVQSAFTAPHIYFFTDIDMGELNQLREKIHLDFERQFKIHISINDFIIKAVALNILEFPILNATLKSEEIYVMPEINIGLAVALEDGLIVPAIPKADQMGLGKIAQMRTDLVERARAGKLKLEEIERGTFTVSSLAQYDVVFFTAILNPPQSGILSIGKTCERLFLKEGRVVARQVARFGLSVDHRIVDGAAAAAFLHSLKNQLEHPTFTFMDV